jgi:hypothetical protein
MRTKVAVVDVFATPCEVWSERNTSMEEAVEMVRTTGVSPFAAFRVKDKLIEVISTHTQAAARMLREHVDQRLERHIDRALDESGEYHDLRNLMPPDEPEAITSYQGEFSKDDWALANEAINAHGVLIADGQRLFHGGHWASASSTLTTARPFSTSFCPQVALRNAEWGGKAYDAGRVDLMVVRVSQPKTKAYAYSREGDHGHEKEVVFASGAKLTRVRETYIAHMTVVKITSSLQEFKKDVPAYVVEVEIS